MKHLRILEEAAGALLAHLERRQAQAFDALDVQRGRVLPGAGNANGSDLQDAEIKTIIDVPESVTSQSRRSLLLQGSPPSGKLLIPFARRDVRVVEGARLENEAGQRHQAASTRINAQKIRDLALQTEHTVRTRKP